MGDVLSYYEGRNVLVTGCSSGIGRAVATKLSEAGAHVLGVDRNDPAPEIVERHLGTDLGDAAAILRTASALSDRIWAVFNCAGLSGGAAEPPTVVRVNFLGLRELLEAVLDRIPRGGSIVSIASAAAQDYAANTERVMPLVRTPTFADGERWLQENASYVRERGGYAVSKEALVLYTLARSPSLASRGIRINVVGPGVTDTPMLVDTAKLHGADFDKRVAMPLGRRATAEEQANILIFLNSDWAAYINGEPIWSDGGTISRRLLTRDGADLHRAGSGSA